MTTSYKEVPAHLTPPEREWLKEIAEHVAKTVPATPCAPMFVHIGVMHGGSLHCSRAGAPNAALVGVDLNLDTLRGDPQAILLRGNSMELGWHFETPIHFLFMDGAHDYPSIGLDIEAWARLVVVGGIMAFHDADYHHVTTAIQRWGGKGWPEITIQPPNTPHTALRIRAFRRGAG